MPKRTSLSKELKSVTQQIVGEVISMTTRNVRRLTKEGMPRNEDGRYDLAEAVKWYVDLQVQRTIEQYGEGHKPVSPELERKRKYDADIQELNLAKRRKELMERADVEAGWLYRLRMVKNSLLRLPKELKFKLSDKGAHDVEVLLDAAVVKVLNEMAESEGEGANG